MPVEWSTLPVTLDLLGECPTWDTETKTLYWTDIPGMALKAWHPASGAHRVWPMPEEVGSFALRRLGGAVLAMRSGYALFDFTTRRLERLASPPYDTAFMRFNDGRAGPDGRFYAGTMYEPRGRTEGRLYRLDTDLTWAELLVAGAAIDPARLAEREAVLDPDDPASIEYDQLAGGELQATTVSHRDHLGGNAFGVVAGKEQDR